MVYGEKIKNKAFTLYLEGKSTREIAKAVKVKKHHTIAAWIKKLGWEKRRHDIDTQAAQKIDKAAAVDIAKRLIEHDRFGRNIRGAATKALKELYDAETTDPFGLAAVQRAGTGAINEERRALGLPKEIQQLNVNADVEVRNKDEASHTLKEELLYAEAYQRAVKAKSGKSK